MTYLNGFLNYEAPAAQAPQGLDPSTITGKPYWSANKSYLIVPTSRGNVQISPNTTGGSYVAGTGGPTSASGAMKGYTAMTGTTGLNSQAFDWDSFLRSQGLENPLAYGSHTIGGGGALSNYGGTAIISDPGAQAWGEQFWERKPDIPFAKDTARSFVRGPLIPLSGFLGAGALAAGGLASAGTAAGTSAAGAGTAAGVGAAEGLGLSSIWGSSLPYGAVELGLGGTTGLGAAGAGAFDAGGMGAAQSMGLQGGYSSPLFGGFGSDYGFNVPQTGFGGGSEGAGAGPWQPQPPYGTGGGMANGPGYYDFLQSIGIDPSSMQFAGGVGAGAGGGGMSLQDLARYGQMVQSLTGAGQGIASLIGANQAAGAARQGAQTQSDMFALQNAQQAPYRQSGYGALSNLNYLTGNLSGPVDPTAGMLLGQGAGSLLRPFTAADLKTNLAPNYEFMRNEGLRAERNAFNAGGGLVSGNAGRGLTKWAEDYAGNAYQQAYQNYNTNQTNIYNRLASIAGLGQTANQQSSQLAGTIAPSIAQSQIAAGQAQSAGTIGLANALASGANNAMSWYSLPQLMNWGV